MLGIANEATRRRLLREQKLTLTTALELCRAAELTERTLKSMEQDKPQTDSVNVAFRQPSNNAPRHNWKPQKKFSPGTTTDSVNACRCCGTQHGRGRQHCPAYGKTCKACGTPNHFARVCMKTKGSEAPAQVHSMYNSTATHETDSGDDLFTTECIGAVGPKGKKWFAALTLNGTKPKCQ